MDHGLNCIDERLILPLCNPIMLWVLVHSFLPLDPCLLADIDELFRGVFTLVVYPQHLDFPSCHVLHLSFESSEMIEDLTLGLRVDPTLSGEVLSEGHIVGSDPKCLYIESCC